LFYYPESSAPPATASKVYHHSIDGNKIQNLIELIKNHMTLISYDPLIDHVI